MRVRVLVNPIAGSGAAARKLPLILRELERAGAHPEAAPTRGPGDAARVVREAREDGIDCVAIVGGDGTLNEASQAYLGSNGEPVEGPALGIIPAGTGGDFRRTFGLGLSVEEAVTRLISSPPRPVDLGILELCAQDGSRILRSFVNIASFGIGGLTDRLVNGGPKWIGGRAGFLLGTLRAMLIYRNAPVRIRVDGNVCFEGPIFNVALANGRFFGGGMKIAPDADPSDGLLDVVILQDLSAFESLSLTPHVYRGTHLASRGVQVLRGHEISADPLSSSTEVLIDMDGETPGQLPLRARTHRFGLRIRI